MTLTDAVFHLREKQKEKVFLPWRLLVIAFLLLKASVEGRFLSIFQACDDPEICTGKPGMFHFFFYLLTWLVSWCKSLDSHARNNTYEPSILTKLQRDFAMPFLGQ